MIRFSGGFNKCTIKRDGTSYEVHSTDTVSGTFCCNHGNAYIALEVTSEVLLCFFSEEQRHNNVVINNKHDIYINNLYFWVSIE